ncbi:hypothetical protein [Syntrophomonas erecta]
MEKKAAHLFTDEQVTIRFIDTVGTDISRYPLVDKTIRQGYSFPITVINDIPRLAGEVSSQAIINMIADLIGDKPDEASQ